MHLFLAQHSPTAVACLRRGDFDTTREALAMLIDACQGQSLTLFEFETLPAQQRQREHAHLVARGLVRQGAEFARIQWLEIRALYATTDREADLATAALLRARARGCIDTMFAYKYWLGQLADAIERHDYTCIVGTDTGDDAQPQHLEALA